MSKVYKILCIRCPKGCQLEVRVEGDKITVKGYGCLEGKKYGEEEIRSPKRMVTTTVRILGARYPRLPVRTSDPVPKEKVREVVMALRNLKVRAPIKRGQVILRDVAGTGVDIIAERDMEVIE